MVNLVRYGILGLTTHAIACGAQPDETLPLSSVPVAEHHASTSSEQSTVATYTTTHTSLTDIAVTPRANTTVNKATLPTASTSSTKLITSTNTATCPSRTVNYITHTLAQQCLRTDWVRSRGSTGVSQISISGDATTIIATASQDYTGTVVQNVTNAAAVEHSSQTNTGSAVYTTTTEPTESDVESPLDTANFLSFEDWKKQNLAKAGQSGESFNSRPHDQARRVPNVNALDSLGEESEIELDFSGFGTPIMHELRQEHDERVVDATDTAELEKTSPASQALRPRDAGRTCKERTNYASFDCAATVLKSNPECKSASSVLVENKDSYMLNKCSADNKYFIVELCNDILVDTVVLANYEFFSSIFRTFRVSVSDRYPAKAEKWKDLGTFEARNTREVQAFLIENPLIWARYLRIEFLTHYGNEYYCPVSLLRVHGTTMMEEFRNQEELARGEPPDEEVVTEISGMPEPVVTPTREHIKDSKQHVAQTESSSQSACNTTEMAPIATSKPGETASKIIKDVITTASITQNMQASLSTCPSDDESATASHVRSTSVNITSSTTSSSTVSPTSPTTVSTPLDSLVSTSTPLTAGDASQSSGMTPNSTLSTRLTETGSMDATKASATSGPGATNLELADSSSKESKTAAETSKSTSSTAPQAQPSTQESFFKSISKRLQQLESNSTLSLLYIEEQSRILRDAFSKVEKRQIGTTATFLSNLNNTVMAELTGFRQAYDQLWQSTVIELEGQQEQHHREMTALSSRLTLVVDELVWQKRMGIVQSTLLLLCLGLVLFARPGTGTFEASLMQQVMARSQAAFGSGIGSQQDSPASPGRSPASLIRRRIPLWRTAETVPELPEDLSPTTSTPEKMPSPAEVVTHANDVLYDENDDGEDAASVDSLQISDDTDVDGVDPI